MKNKIIYITPVLVPSASAASKRILANAKLIQLLEYEVEIYSGIEVGEKQEIEGVSIVPTGIEIEKNEGIKKLIAYRKSIQGILLQLENQDILNLKAIFVYSGYSFYLAPLIRWCTSKKIPLVFDAVEWYTPAKNTHWLFKPYYWNTEIAMRYFIPKTKNVIAISTFLERNYQLKKCNTTVIPPLFYNKTNFFEREDRPYIQLSYTGSPGKKDNLNEIVTAILEINKQQFSKEVRFEIAGINEEQLLSYPVFLEKRIVKLPSNIAAHGYISIDLAQEITSNSDFSILFRKNDKTNTAGFPTKVVESLSLGTPIFLNYSSDLHLFLHDGINAIVIDEFSVENLKSVLIKIIEMPFSQLQKMRKSALQTADESFSIHSRTKLMDSFLKQLKI